MQGHNETDSPVLWTAKSLSILMTQIQRIEPPTFDIEIVQRYENKNNQAEIFVYYFY